MVLIIILIYNTNMINIIGLNACKNIHPNSFELDGYHGGIRALD